MSDKIIVLNAPPSGGKDTIANEIASEIGYKHCRFKTHLYRCTATLFNMDEDRFISIANDTELKEVPMEKLAVTWEGFSSICRITNSNRAFKCYNDKVLISPREALIFTSEVVIKPNMGEDYFGRMAAATAKSNPIGTVFSDGGFQSEVDCLAEIVGGENLYIVQFTRGDKKSFGGDSRGWLEATGNVNLLVTENNGEVYEIVDQITKWVLND